MMAQTIAAAVKCQACTWGAHMRGDTVDEVARFLAQRAAVHLREQHPSIVPERAAEVPLVAAVTA